VNVSDDAYDISPANRQPKVAGALTWLGSGNNYQPILVQWGSDNKFALDLSDILPKDGLLTQISIQVMGTAGWGTSLPTSLPLLVLQYVSSAGGIDLDPVVVHTVASQADTSATYGQFQLKHYITLVLGTPLDLATVGDSHQIRVYLVIAGAVEGTGDLTSAVAYFNARAHVTSKAWA
jgi:hypothetical protein